MQERLKSIANALKLRLHCTNPSIYHKDLLELCKWHLLVIAIFIYSHKCASWGRHVRWYKRQKLWDNWCLRTGLFQFFQHKHMILLPVLDIRFWPTSPCIFGISSWNMCTESEQREISGNLMYHMYHLQVEPIKNTYHNRYHCEMIMILREIYPLLMRFGRIYEKM